MKARAGHGSRATHSATAREGLCRSARARLRDVLVLVFGATYIALGIVSFAYLVVGDWKPCAISAWLSVASFAAVFIVLYLHDRAAARPATERKDKETSLAA